MGNFFRRKTNVAEIVYIKNNNIKIFYIPLNKLYLFECPILNYHKGLGPLCYYYVTNHQEESLNLLKCGFINNELYENSVRSQIISKNFINKIEELFFNKQLKLVYSNSDEDFFTKDNLLKNKNIKKIILIDEEK